MLIKLALGTGMSESEIWNLHLADARLDLGSIVVGLGGKGKATKAASATEKALEIAPDHFFAPFSPPLPLPSPSSHVGQLCNVRPWF